MPDGLGTRVVLGRASSSRGEIVLVRRSGEAAGRPPDGTVDELVVNGAFAMDSSQTSSEIELGRLARGARRVLVGGLGLGCTVAALLDEADEAGTEVSVDVVELEPVLIDWAREGLTPTLGRTASDHRVRLHAGDVADVLAGTTDRTGRADRTGTTGPTGPWDAVLLDVDNGPDFLIHPANGALYGEAGLRAAYARLAPGGLLAIWCQAPSADLLAALRDLDAAAEQRTYAVTRGRRSITYAIAVARRPHARGAAGRTAG